MKTIHRVKNWIVGILYFCTHLKVKKSWLDAPPLRYHCKLTQFQKEYLIQFKSFDEFKEAFENDG